MSGPPFARTLGVLVAVLALVYVTAGCSGDDPTDAAAGVPQYEIQESQCDGIRAAGTITNRSGGDAAFEITARFTYTEGSSGLPIQSTVTGVLADGESTEFSISSDRAGDAPSGCRIVGAEVVDTAEATDAESEQTAANAPDSIEDGWVAVGSGGTILVSEDGENWFPVDSGTTEGLTDVAYGDDEWVAVGFGGVVVTSEDGVVWEAGSTGTDLQLERVRFEDGEWQARPAHSSDLLVSPDAAAWTLQQDAFAVDPNAPDHSEPFTVTDAGDGRELAIGRPGSYGGQLLFREGETPFAPLAVRGDFGSGVGDQEVSLSVTDFDTDGEGTWVFVGGINERQFVVSDDLQTWVARGESVYTLNGIDHDGAGRWVAVGDQGRLFTSSDAQTWEEPLPRVTEATLTAIVHTA